MENEISIDLRMVSSSAKMNQAGGFFSVATTRPIRWMMAIVLEQWPVSVLSMPSRTVGMLLSVTRKLFLISFFDYFNQLFTENVAVIDEALSVRRPCLLDDRNAVVVELGARLHRKIQTRFFNGFSLFRMNENPCQFR